MQSSYPGVGSSDGNYIGSSNGNYIGSSDGNTNYPQENPPFQSGPRPNSFDRLSRGRGRGRGNGRGRGRSLSLPRQHRHQNSTSLNSVPTGQPNSAPGPSKAVRCEVCNIECDTIEILELHKNGKKHQKNLKKNAIGGHVELASHSNAVSEAPFWPSLVEGNSTVQGIMPAQPLPQYQAGLGIQGQSRAAAVPPKAVTCELCKVDCNTAEIFEKHKNGKKHQKNLKVYEELQKWKTVSAVQVEQASTSELGQEVPSQPEKIEQSQEETLLREVGNEESRVAVEKQKNEDVEPTEESADKVAGDQSEGRGRGFKRKMRGGRGGRNTRPFNGSKRSMEPPKPKEVIPLVCELCNVKCESLVVFQSHLTGKKHQMKAKRYLTPQEIIGQEILAAIGPALQVLMQQGALASTSMAPPLQHQGFGQLPGALPQNFVNFQAPALGANPDNATMEALGQLIAPHLVNMQGMSNATHPLSQGEIYYPAGGMACEQTDGMPSSTEPVASEPANGASGFESNMASAPPGLDNTTGQVDVPANGTDSAQ